MVDTCYGAGFVRVGGVPAYSDGADHLALVDDEHPAGRGDEPPAGRGCQRREELGQLTCCSANVPRVESQTQRRPRLSGGDLDPKECGAILPLENEGVAAGDWRQNRYFLTVVK